jgi:hypothetical protein
MTVITCIQCGRDKGNSENDYYFDGEHYYCSDCCDMPDPDPRDYDLTGYDDQSDALPPDLFRWLASATAGHGTGEYSAWARQFSAIHIEHDQASTWYVAVNGWRMHIVRLDGHHDDGDGYLRLPYTYDDMAALTFPPEWRRVFEAATSRASAIELGACNPIVEAGISADPRLFTTIWLGINDRVPFLYGEHGLSIFYRYQLDAPNYVAQVDCQALALALSDRLNWCLVPGQHDEPVALARTPYPGEYSAPVGEMYAVITPVTADSKATAAILAQIKGAAAV